MYLPLCIFSVLPLPVSTVNYCAPIVFIIYRTILKCYEIDFSLEVEVTILRVGAVL